MTRARTWVSIVLPFAFACGVSHAQPAPPHAPPAPPAPPAPHVVGIGPGGVDLTGIQRDVDKQLADAIATIRKNPQIPPALRDKLIARMDKVRAKVDHSVAHLDVTNLDAMGDQLGAIGDEISEALDGIDVDTDQIGSDVAREVIRDVTHSLQHGPDREIKRAVHDAMRNSRVHGHHHDGDDDDDDDSMAGVSIDADDDHDDDDDATISNVGNLALKQAQRDEIARLRGTTKATVTSSRHKLDDLSSKLRDALTKDGTPDAEIARDIDAISAEEATIRKAKILAWVQARRILDAQQRARVESAAKPKSK